MIVFGKNVDKPTAEEKKAPNNETVFDCKVHSSNLKNINSTSLYHFYHEKVQRVAVVLSLNFSTI